MSTHACWPRSETLLIVSHVVHYQADHSLSAYGPYAREIDIWADLFPHVIIAAPCRREPPPGDCLAFSRSNISIVSQRETGGESVRAKLRQAALLPALAWDLGRAMRRADAIHVRCPGNLGLLGAVMAPCFSTRLIAKYAGQWNGYGAEPLTVRFQRAVLRSRWWRGPVTVYGKWPDQASHICPFFTSMMSRDHVAHARTVAARKRLSTPLRVLYSGRLTAVKRVDALLDAVKLVVDAGLPVEVTIVGDGPDRQALASRAMALRIGHCVTFVGAQPFEQALRWYEWAHCLVLPSEHSEGWPKVLAEGMCHGVLCVAVDHGQVRAMLADRGILLEAGTPRAMAAALQSAATEPGRYEPMMRDGAEWARQYSLEGLRDAINDLLAREWGLARHA